MNKIDGVRGDEEPGTPVARNDVSLSEARRIALAAQGFDRPRPRRVEARQLAGTIRRLGLLQIDYVNVLVPAHYMVPFSRVGPYERTLLDEVVYRRGEFTEQWAHEASIIPVETWPLLRHRMATHRVRPYGFEAFLQKNPRYVQSVLDEVRKRGPLTADDLPAPDGADRRIAGSWFGSVPRATLEAHFGRGLLGVTERRPGFVRAFDLAERLLPAELHRREVARHDAQRELVRLAARVQGIAAASDLADYYRMPVRDVLQPVAELVAAGELSEVRVEGWREPAYLHREARVPPRVEAAALLAPFDPLVWHRPRAARLFGFHYRFEIFVPAEKRKWGCYVLPFLLGDRLVARVDLKAERAERRLAVLAAYVERDAKAGVVATPLAAELRTLARWLGLDVVTVASRAGFARTLAAALRG